MCTRILLVCDYPQQQQHLQPSASSPHLHGAHSQLVQSQFALFSFSLMVNTSYVLLAISADIVCSYL
jgi:hypothetical protein